MPLASRDPLADRGRQRVRAIVAAVCATSKAVEIGNEEFNVPLVVRQDRYAVRAPRYREESCPVVNLNSAGANGPPAAARRARPAPNFDATVGWRTFGIRVGKPVENLPGPRRAFVRIALPNVVKIDAAERIVFREHNPEAVGETGT
jgi:hypothetical protein